MQGQDRKENMFHRAGVYMRQHHFLMPAVLAFSCFIIVVLLAISIWFSTSVSTNLENAVYETAAQQSAMGAETLRLTLDGFGTLCGWVSELEQVAPRAYRANSYRAYIAFKDYDVPVFRFSNLMLYYGRDVGMLSVRGTSWPEVLFPAVTDMDGFLDHLDGLTGKQLLCTMDYGAPQTQNTLVLANPLPNHTLALFTLEYADLYNLIAPGAAGTDTTLRMILDKNSAALWSNSFLTEDALNIIRSHSEQDTPKRILTMGGEDYLYSVAAISNGASLITLDRVTTQFDTVYAAIRVLVAVCIILLVIGVTLLILGMQRSGAPIMRLFNTVREALPQQEDMPDNVVDALSQVCSQYSMLVHESSQKNALLSNEQLRDLFILRIICGQYSDPEELEHLCGWLNVAFPHRYFVACLMLFEQPPDEQERGYIETHLRRVTHEGFTCCFCLTPDGRSAVGLVNIASNSPESLRSFGHQLLSHLLEHTSVTVGLGDVYENMNMLGRSYLEAHAALERRLILGKDTCILYAETHVAEGEMGALYPQQLLDDYVNCLRQWDAAAIQQELDKIIAFIHQNDLPLQQVKCICFELTASLLREISRMGSLTASLDSAVFDVFSIAEYASVSELAQNIVNLSQTIQQCVEARRKRRKDNLITQCIQHMQDNISNAQFSLSMLAEQFDVTPQTLRRNFKEATGQTLSNYLISLRIERAKQLLVETDLDLSNICVQCGYIDVSSFARLFKSEVGTAPGSYRENQRRD